MALLKLTVLSKNGNVLPVSRPEGFSAENISDVIAVQSSIPAMPGNAQFTYSNGAVKEVYTVSETLSEVIDLQYHS